MLNQILPTPFAQFVEFMAGGANRQRAAAIAIVASRAPSPMEAGATLRVDNSINRSRAQSNWTSNFSAVEFFAGMGPPANTRSHKPTRYATMLGWLKKKIMKWWVLSQIVEVETVQMNRTAFDFFAQAAIRQRMVQAGYKYVGNPGKADAAHAGSYRP